MQRILTRRVFRMLKENIFRYLALFFMIVMGMYIVIALIGAAEMIIRGVEKGYRENRVEDGQFSVFVPLSDQELQQIEELGVTLEDCFYMDYHREESTLRIYRNRDEINLFSLKEGTKELKNGEILLEQHYAASHGIKVGDRVMVGSKSFIVAGVGSTPDYDAAYEKMSDASVDSSLFGNGFVTGEDYERLREAGESFKTEELCYSYLLGEEATDDELKALLQSFALDKTQVKDPYFQEMIEEAEETKNDITGAIDELKDGCEELSAGLSEIEENNAEVMDGVNSLFDTMLEQVNSEFKDGGIGVVLKEDTFAGQLDDMIANPSAYTGKTKEELIEIRDSLKDLLAFKTGVKEYTNGVKGAYEGSGQLQKGLKEIADNSPGLQKGADQIFEAMLALANEELAPYGVTLTSKKYEKQLDKLIETYGAMDPAINNRLTTLKQQLQQIDEFRSGVYTYTGGVDQAASGSLELTEGMKALCENADPLNEGVDAILGAMTDMVNAQLRESGIEANITMENYESRIAMLTENGSVIDTKMKESLLDSKELLTDLADFKEGMQEYTDGVKEAAEGSLALLDGVEELEKEADEMLEEYFTFDMDNLTSFVPRKDNPRIGASVNDVIINKVAGLVAGVIVMGLFTYVISVFVVHSIEQESSIIGALYALGVKRKHLLFHYLVLPVLVTFLGGAVGCAVGFSPIGVYAQANDTLAYFSLPLLDMVYPGYLLVYGMLMPPLTAIVVNYLVINKKLNRTALSLMRGEGKVNRIKEINLGRLGFVKRFQIRQMLREFRSGAAVVVGMFICLLIAMIGINCYVLCDAYSKAAVRETNYAYMYSYKYPTEQVPEGGTAGYMEGLTKEAFGYTMNVSVLGLAQDNEYYDVAVSDKKNEIVISSAVASKFDVAKGEKLVLSDDVNDRDYAFTVIDVVPHNASLEVYMDIDAMRELFGREEDYYNIVFAGEELSIDAGRLYSVMSRDSIVEASRIFVEMMWPMIIMMTVMAGLVFAVVMYLMMKVMIDRSAFHISLMKVFGYRKREVKRLYIDGNFVIIALGALVCVPGAKWIMDLIYPYFVSNVGIGLELSFSWQLYAGIYGIILVMYLLIQRMLVWRVHKISLVEVLKNRE